MLFGPCEVFKQTGRELLFIKLCLTLVFFHSMQVCRLRPCKAFKQTGRELSFIKLCLTLVFFHLHAGMQVPLKMEPAKTTSSNLIRNGKSSFPY